MSRYMDGWNESHSSQDGDRANNERQILQDLIAELRAEPGREVYSALGHVEQLLAAADRAESRLRELTGDE